MDGGSNIVIRMFKFFINISNSCKHRIILRSLAFCLFPLATLVLIECYEKFDQEKVSKINLNDLLAKSFDLAIN